MNMKHLTLVTLISLLCFAGSVYSQQQIRGRVSSSTDDESLVGVTILVKGTQRGAITDMNGNYSINATSGDTLVFSYLEYEKVSEAVGNRVEIDVTMIPDIKTLSEVVVVGYGTVLKKDVTTAITSVNPDEIPKAANNNVNDLLFGRAAGLQVSQQSAQPGGGVNLRIRGRQQNPLIVVDGVVLPRYGLEPGVNFTEIDGVQRSGLAGLNPNDIESIEVLKDGSASIYGIGASDGVILITTKKGSTGKVQVNYSGNYSFVQNMPYLEPLSSREYMTYYNQFEADRYNFNNSMAPFGTTPSDYVPSFTQGEIDSAGDGTNWVGEVLQSGSIINQNLNFSGGTDKISYYFSANYYDQEGTVKNSGLTKYGTRLNMSYIINKYITVKANLNAGNSNYLNNGSAWQTGNAGSNAFRALQSAFAYPAYLPIKDDEGNYTIWQTIPNPVALLDLEDKTEYNSLLMDFNVDLNILPKVLKATISYGNNNENAYREFYIPSTVFWFDESRARASLNNSKRQFNTFEALLSFEKVLGKIRLNAIAGYGEYLEQTRSFGLQAQDMLDAIGVTNVAAGTATPKVNSSLIRNRKRSYFTRATIDLLDKYLVTASLRYDGFSYFFPESKYAAFPSVSVGWKINNESFLSSASAINLLKLRASYGITGRASNGSIAYGGFEPEDITMPFDDATTRYTAYYISRFDNPDLTWEKTSMINVGLDFAIFNNRLTGAIDWFKDDITNLLDESARTPALSFLVSAPQNGGHQVRTGYDIGLTYDVIRQEKFEWETFVNLTHYLFRWEERFIEDVVLPYQDVKDQVDAIYCFETNGILQLDETPSAWQPATALMPGAPVFVDQNGDNVLDSADVVLYSPTPKLAFGWGNVFKYMNFDLSIQLYGQIGAYRQNPTLGWADPNNGILGGISGSTDLERVWSTGNTDGTLPGSPYSEAALAQLVGSDYNLMKTDFLRARNITLGYTHNFKSHINSARIYFDIQNAFILTKYYGADPEVDVRTVKVAPAPYPMARTYSLGLNINF
jgi:TonB-dependent starch-binding outer membrane protein SusC